MTTNPIKLRILGDESTFREVAKRSQPGKPKIYGSINLEFVVIDNEKGSR